jgi:nitroreductase
MNETLAVIARRRSTRRFLPRPVADSELRAVLEAGVQAPSGHNDQSWYLAAVQNAVLIDELSDGAKAEMARSPVEWIAALGRNGKFHIYHGAPTAVLVAARKDAVTPGADAGAAVQNMLIAAESLGLGSCWIGFTPFYFTTPERHLKFGIPEGYAVHFGVALGYRPGDAPADAPARKRDRYYHVMK